MEREKVDQFTRRSQYAIAGILHGQLPNKSNSRRIFRLAGGRTIIAKSADALAFVDHVKHVAKYSNFGEMLDGATNEKDWKKGKPLLYIKIAVVGASFERDLDVELLQDALQAAGIINNDRAIRHKVITWELDKANPRVVFEVGYITKLEATA